LDSKIAAPAFSQRRDGSMIATSRFLLNVLAFLTLALAAWCVPEYKALHSFTGGNDGCHLWGSLLLDSKGNAYGTTYGCGANTGGGTVFELSPKRNGTWAETTLYSFCSQSECTDGGGSTAGLIFDAVGNLYGTTELGGSDASGTVFELSPQGDGTWSESVLYSFGNQGPVAPYAGVIMDPAGNLYGTGGGYAYQLSPGSAGWTLSDLHAFTGQNGDGNGPLAGVIRDPSGSLYGTTEHGGADRNCGGGCGTVYRLHPETDDTWKETILYDFDSCDCAFPGSGALVMDKLGNLYGTTTSGAIYELSPRPRGPWKEATLYDAEGQEPVGGVVMDKAGALYGTTSAGGKAGCGTVYKLAPAARDKWKYSVLHTFLGSDGCGPEANLVIDSKGNLYGTTTLGGTYGVGVAFELTP
jgi:uncharacterized repeat protein (TIGR03803 family)